jgi:hypothetical protein
LCYGCLTLLLINFSYILVVSFVGGGNQSTRRQYTCQMSLTNYITWCSIEYMCTSPWVWIKLTVLVLNDNDCLCRCDYTVCSRYMMNSRHQVNSYLIIKLRIYSSYIQFCIVVYLHGNTSACMVDFWFCFLFLVF